MPNKDLNKGCGSLLLSPTHMQGDHMAVQAIGHGFIPIAILTEIILFEGSDITCLALEKGSKLWYSTEYQKRMRKI